MKRFADRDRDGDRGRVAGVGQAVGDQFRGEQDRVIGGRMLGGGLPDELPCCRRDPDMPGEGLV